MLTYEFGIQERIERDSEGFKDLFLRFGRRVEQAAAVQTVSGDYELRFIQLQQDLLKREVPLVHIGLQQTVHSGILHQKNASITL